MIEDPLQFSRSERRVILFFTLSVTLLAFIPVPDLFEAPDWHRIDSLTCIINNTDTPASENNISLLCDKKDIDKIAKEDWLQLGAPSWLAERIQKYRTKGGRIRHAADLKKIYGIDSIWVNRIDSCIIWKKQQPFRSKYSHNKHDFKPPMIYINKADSAEWMKLKGIGKVLSKRIVKFREKLGGFHSIEQVADTYGISDSLFQEIEKYLIIEIPPEKINLNVSDFQLLSDHPYISFREARIIINYRKAHGPFNDISDLYKIIALDSIRINKWTPYLSLDTELK